MMATTRATTMMAKNMAESVAVVAVARTMAMRDDNRDYDDGDDNDGGGSCSRLPATTMRSMML